MATDSELKFSSRHHMINKERAIGTAKSPKDSHYGRTLLRNNVFEGRLLSTEMGKLGNEARRKQMHLDQQKKLFLKKNLSLPDPMILVERPPSAGVIKKALFPEEFTEDDYYFNENAPPHYMKPRSTHITAPSTHVITDMFKVTKKKKFNVWEQVLIEKQEPHFESAVRPARKLSALENRELEKAWNAHRRQIESVKVPPLPRTKTQSVLSIKPLEEFTGRVKTAPDFPGQFRKTSQPKVKSVTFITQLPDYEDDSSVAESEGCNRTTSGFQSMPELTSKESNKHEQVQASTVEGLISVSLSAIDSNSTHAGARGPKMMSETVKHPSEDIHKPHNSPLNHLKKAPEPRVIQATKRRPKSIKDNYGKEPSITHACNTGVSNDSDKMQSSRIRSPGSGTRKKKRAFLSILVDDSS